MLELPRGTWRLARAQKGGLWREGQPPPSSALAPPGRQPALTTHLRSGPWCLSPFLLRCKGRRRRILESFTVASREPSTHPACGQALPALRPLTPSPTAPGHLSPQAPQPPPVRCVLTEPVGPLSPRSPRWGTPCLPPGARNGTQLPPSPYHQDRLGDGTPRTGAIQESGGFQPRWPFHT